MLIERLEEDAANLVWVLSHEAEESVPLTAVSATVAADYLQMVDPDRVSNPHGEHALEAYRLLEPVGEALAALAAAAAAADTAAADTAAAAQASAAQASAAEAASSQ